MIVAFYYLTQKFMGKHNIRVASYRNVKFSFKARNKENEFKKN